MGWPSSVNSGFLFGLVVFGVASCILCTAVVNVNIWLVNWANFSSISDCLLMAPISMGSSSCWVCLSMENERLALCSSAAMVMALSKVSGFFRTILFAMLTFLSPLVKSSTKWLCAMGWFISWPGYANWALVNILSPKFSTGSSAVCCNFRKVCFAYCASDRSLYLAFIVVLISSQVAAGFSFTPLVANSAAAPLSDLKVKFRILSSSSPTTAWHLSMSASQSWNFIWHSPSNLLIPSISSVAFNCWHKLFKCLPIFPILIWIGCTPCAPCCCCCCAMAVICVTHKGIRKWSLTCSFCLLPEISQHQARWGLCAAAAMSNNKSYIIYICVFSPLVFLIAST